MSTPATDPSARRAPAGLDFDPAGPTLTLCGHSATVDPAAGNRGILNAYVELMARCRHDRIANLEHVRHEDMAALADALDLDADGLEAEVLAILGAARADALQMAMRMKRSRHIGGIGRAAIAVRPADG